MFIYKRKIFLKITAFIIATVLLCCCGCTPKIKEGKRSIFDGFSAHVLDVGEGDCIFIRFPDGKNMLIDSGDKDSEISDYVVGFLDDYGVEKIDYLLITHPDSDHAGNALDIINKFPIEFAFVPDITEQKLIFYQTYKTFYERLITVTEKVEISDCYKIIKGEDYAVVFITPTPKSFINSSYWEFNGAIEPTSAQSNALSPIIYVEYCGVRFMFTGDAPASQEKLALEQINVMKDYYDLQKISVDIENIDFLKISHHGADDASCWDFLWALTPKNAIISVGGNNNYGHPTKKILERLQTVNPDYKLWRTDVHGTVSVNVNRDGTFSIITDKNIA